MNLLEKIQVKHTQVKEVAYKQKINASINSAVFVRGMDSF